MSKDTASASDNILGIASGFCFLSLPSRIWIPDKTALCTALSLQNFSVVSNNHCKSVSSLDTLATKSFTFLYSSSFKSFLLLSSINIDSLVGRLLYFCKNFSTSINKIFSSLL